MASLSSPTTATTTTTTTLSSAPLNPLLSKPSQLSAFRSNQARRVAPKISCNAAKNDNNVETNKFDRRNMLIGLGGLYGATTTLSGSGSDALAAPTAPEVTNCGISTVGSGDNTITIDCCPPKPSQFVDFKLPNTNRALNIRPAAHLIDNKYLEKYWKALELMKALPDSDPRSFNQQAKVHCAYCNGGYEQAGLPDLQLQVHNSWLFFPFHRAYLYFYEKILGKLIDDPTFAIPYWNWDHPDGMSMPPMFNIPSSPFFDENRDPNHRPPTLMDLSYDGSEQEKSNFLTYDQQIKQNLSLMYRQMVSNAKPKRLFLGEPYRAGTSPNPGAGSLENQPHGPIHVWTGNPANELNEDMGTFYSAGKDPIFYAHHANVDRTWSIWKDLHHRNRDFNDPDFLNSYFFFYDENAKPVRIFVRDVLDTRKLGYDYQFMDIPWIHARPTPHGRGHGRGRGHKHGHGNHGHGSHHGHGHGHMHGAMFSDVKNAAAAETTPTPTPTPTPTLTFPKPLNHIIRTNLARPSKARSSRQKSEEEEVLVIDVETKRDVYSKFDVYVNDEDEAPTKENRTQTEYAGSFVNVPHKHKHGESSNLMTTTVRFGLTELIDDLGADDDDGIDVIFVPRTGTESMVIKDVRIEFLN